jgi:Xaa-Pro dipeptidase
MLSRRSFLALSSLGAATAWPAAAQTPEAPSGRIPAAIAALRSREREARPITQGERAIRLEKARRLMTEHRIDAVMLTGGTSLVYFTDIRWGVSERLFAMVLPRSGAPFFVCPAFEEGRALEQIAAGPFDGSPDIRTWHEHESPYQRVAQGLADRGLTTGRVGMEETVRFVFGDGVAAATPALDVVSGTPVVAGCRMVKDAHEIELMRLASEVTLAAYEAAYRSLEEGMTQRDFARLVSMAHDHLGFSGNAGVQVGEYSALPHGSRTPQVIRQGTILLIDGGCVVADYRSDLSRTFVLGTATDKMKHVFEIVRRAQDAALEAATPGVACEAVDAAARRVVEDAGFGPGYAHFTHRVGHGLGMDMHEWPYLVRGNTLPMTPGMTFSDEPGVYLPGEFGVRVEDDMAITEDGAILLTPQSPSLEEPFS